MSNIFGIYNLDNRPAEKSRLLQMKNALLSTGTTGDLVYLNDSMGLGVTTRMNTSKQSISESHMVQQIVNHLACTSAARIDNRNDLLSLLNIPDDKRHHITNNTLISLAYKKWQTDCPAKLIGDWAFAIWDAQKQRLVLARDQFGVSTLYYFQNHNTFCFSSCLTGLLAIKDLDFQLNPTGLANRYPRMHRDNMTCYKNIFTLTPGNTLTVTTKQTKRQQYWTFNTEQPIHYCSEQEYLDAFVDIYSQAIQCRLAENEPTGIMLSSGLDSSSVATIAAQQLSKNNQKLHAFSAIPFYNTTDTDTKHKYGNEAPLIKDIINFCGNIEPNYINSTAITPLDGIKQFLDTMGQPMLGATNMYWLTTMFRSASQQKVGTLLTGNMGNFTVSWSGDRDQYLLSLLKTGQWRTYLHEICAWRSLHHASLNQTFASQVRRPFLPNSFKNYIKRNRSRHRFDIFTQNFIEKYVIPRQQATKHNSFLQSPLRELYTSYRSGLNTGGNELGAPYGLQILAPTMDIRLVEFCLNIPLSLYTKNGWERLLIRNSMRDKLPDHVIWNQKRGSQTADIAQRIITNQTQISATLSEMKQFEVVKEYLDIGYLSTLLQQITQTNPISLKQFQQSIFLLNAVMIGLFLQKFE
ncbi:MAG: hypothetical protein K0U68_06960 [Gammaproteobacteria bacterium]|nr:hypothetical protein [Gammaproteobacteria bacterium]